MSETKKIDNTFTIKENKSDDTKPLENPEYMLKISKDENGNVTKKAILYKNKMKYAPIKTIKLTDDNVKILHNKEPFGFARGLNILGLFTIDIPEPKDILSQLRIDDVFDEIKSWFDPIIEGINNAVDLSKLEELTNKLKNWNPIEDLTEAFKNFDIISIMKSILTIIVQPFVEVMGIMFGILYEILKPFIAMFIPSATVLWFYYCLIPALLLISGLLSLANASMGIMNQLRGIEL